MKKVFQYIALATIVLLYNSCSDEFLDVPPTENISDKDLSIYNNDQGAKSFVNSIYNKLLDGNLSGFSWMGLSSITSDDADKGSDPGDTGTDKNKCDALTLGPTDISVEEVFVGSFQCINRVNVALDYLPKLDKVDPNLRNRLAGEAKFIRGMIYFNLVRAYGDVPIVDHLPLPTSQADTDMLLIRKPSSEVYDFIIQDLNSAIAVLPEKTVYPAADLGRATKGAAHALLAKVYLYQKNWAKVKEHCAAVVGYDLITDYTILWREASEFNNESIFEISGFGGIPSQGVEGYMVIQGGRGNSGWGWGFNVPSKNLSDSYEAADLRREATIIYAGETMWDGRNIALNIVNPMYSEKAYVSNTKETFNGDWETTKNIRVLRYAEVLLMQAEAANESGSGDVIGPLNRVRNRAGLPNTTATGQTALRDAIRVERRHELAFEHDRWFDLIRTGQAKTAMAADGKNFVVGKNELFPIPQKFVNEGGGKTTQNPGYNN
jgi:hypothetical protein